MKLVKRDIACTERDKSGMVVLVPEEPEDMWHVYNMIAQGDFITASTMRKVVTESSTGSSTSQRVHTKVTIKVETIDFDATACHLRFKGKNATENKYIKLGAYHTIDLELNRSFVLQKTTWDLVALDRLELACDPKMADVGAIVMQAGLANICLVTSCMTTVRARIEMVIPRKRRGGCEQHDKALVRFYDAVLQAMLRHFDFSVLKCVVIASPGFVKDKFFQFMFTEAVKSENKLLFENKGKFVMAHSSSGHKYSLKEVLQDHAVANRLADTKAAGEVKALESFFQMLQHNSDRAFYGIKHVEYAVAHQAVDVLMVTDELFRAYNIATRKRFIRLIEEVKEYGGDVKIFSSLHVSGERLGQLTGVAAILRFPLPELEDLDDDDDDGDRNIANGDEFDDEEPEDIYAGRRGGGSGSAEDAEDEDAGAQASSSSVAAGNKRADRRAEAKASPETSRSATPATNGL